MAHQTSRDCGAKMSAADRQTRLQCVLIAPASENSLSRGVDVKATQSPGRDTYLFKATPTIVREAFIFYV